MSDSVPLIIVQCRHSSKRLPGKALYPIAQLPMMVFLLRRLKDNLPEDEYNIVLATTKLISDDPVAIWAESEGIQTYRGEVDDVLKRYITCLEKYPANWIVRVTADNPLTCPDLIKKCVSKLIIEDLDYIETDGCPYGCGVDAYSYKTLKRLDAKAVTDEDREHINKFIIDHPNSFTKNKLLVESPLQRPDLRMTVDTLEDWKALNRLFINNDKEPWNITLHEAIARMDSANI